jgi:hypothetical protein
MTERLLTVAELAEWLAVERSYVYEHAAELGALRLGTGPRARLRFDLEEVRARLTCPAGRGSQEPETPVGMPKRRPRRRRRMGTTVRSVPIQGRIGAS